MTKSNESSRPHRERLLRHARAYIQRGFFIVPISRGQKHPKIKGWQKMRLRLKDLREAFCDAGGIGLLLKPSQLTDIDFDSVEAVAAAKILLPSTGMVQGRRGNPSSHDYFRVTPTPKNKSFADPRRMQGEERANLVEIRGNGQTVAPPSRHFPTGEIIKWESQGEAKAIDADVLYRAVAKVASAALVARYWPRGSRHFAAMALAGMLLRTGWTEKATKKFVLAVASAAGDEESASRLQDVMTTGQRLREGQQVTGVPTLSEIVGDDIVGKVREWLDLKCENEESSPHHTDLGNARRFVAQHGQNVRFCFASGKFLVWDGSRWAPDITGKVERLAKDTIQSIYSQAGGTTESSARSELAKHALKSEAEPRIRAMLSLAKTEPTIPVTPKQFDANPWHLNCINGTLDLRTGKLLPHNRNNLCTKQVPVAFDQGATCPTWKEFLNRILAGNRPLIRYIQRCIGYALTGFTTEQVLHFLYGTGANGKTTFIEMIRSLLGDYAQQADFDTFLAKKNEGPRNDLARLNGARFVSAVEAAQGRRLAETVIKQTTGGDTITARYLFHEFFEFTPQFKLFLVANHKPQVKGTDEAIWRRIRLVPFTVTIPRAERDKKLPEKLQRELPGVLAWAVRGCLKWQRDGLGEPVEVSEATAAYRREMDLLADFLEDRCVVGEREWVNAGLLYEVFKKWAEDTGEELLTQKKLGEQLHERGFTPGKKRGHRGWLGLRLRKESEDE